MKIKNIIRYSMLLLISLALIISCCYASPSEFAGNTTVATGTKLTQLGGIITGVIQAVGIIVSVAVLIYLGIKYMLAAPGERATIKSSLTPYLVGVGIVFATSNLVKIIYDIAITF